MKPTPEQITADARSGYVARRFRQCVEKLAAESQATQDPYMTAWNLNALVGKPVYDVELDRCRKSLDLADAERIALAIRFAYASVAAFEKAKRDGEAWAISPDVAAEFHQFAEAVSDVY